MKNGTRVYIATIKETGTVVNVRKDVMGEELITVQRDSDKELHVCRGFEALPLKPTHLYRDTLHPEGL